MTFHGEKTTPAPAEPEPPEAATKPVPGAAPAAAKAPPKKVAPIEVLIRADKLPPAVTSLSRAEVRQLPGAFGDPFRAIEVLPGRDADRLRAALLLHARRAARATSATSSTASASRTSFTSPSAPRSSTRRWSSASISTRAATRRATAATPARIVVRRDHRAARRFARRGQHPHLRRRRAWSRAASPTGAGTALVGGRYSYTAALFSLISPELTPRLPRLPGADHLDLTPEDRIGLFAFGAYDLLAAEEERRSRTSLFGSEFYRFDLRYDHRFADGGKLRWATTGGFDQTRIARPAERAATCPWARASSSTEPVEPRASRCARGIDAQFDSYTADPRAGAIPEDPDTKALQRALPAAHRRRARRAGETWCGSSAGASR